MNNSVTRYVSLTAVIALASIVVLTYQFPYSASEQWLRAFALLLILSLIGAALSVRVTASGSTTSINFLLHIGAVPLLGLPGAIFLAALSTLVADLFIRERSTIKLIFNASQTTIATAAAGIVFIVTGPSPSLDSLNVYSAIIPLIGAGLVYFTLNSFLVTLAISVESGASPVAIWKDIAGPKYFLIYTALTPLAVAVPLLYIHWGSLGLLAIIVPIIGLRYSLGLNLELRNLNRDLLRVLIKTLEAQDPYTSGHSVRVSENARAIAKELGLRRHQIHHIETAALLHDIGKVGQDYSEILRQEGTLDERQKQIIKEHPDRGANIVSPVRSLDPSVIEAIRHHHERYDGDGYPDGLQGNDIPLGARIIMVADTIDAMATNRPYRSSLSTPEIGEELRRHSGDQFDPRVVDAAIEAGILNQEPYVSEGPVDS